MCVSSRPAFKGWPSSDRSRGGKLDQECWGILAKVTVFWIFLVGEKVQDSPQNGQTTNASTSGGGPSFKTRLHPLLSSWADMWWPVT
ncbi:unnamed protein product [Protopolystoma xenopodis]|uniref:Uncharacterized protein n=1 Tax=Protopolystoma xenopodis TaxID=117903 RepID=A0A448X6B2_9PLAT|nr:unnamed protein product [Protopolystoma xenopodis]